MVFIAKAMRYLSLVKQRLRHKESAEKTKSLTGKERGSSSQRVKTKTMVLKNEDE